MKKQLLTLGLISITSLTFAEGTINPLNGALARFKVDSNGDGIGDRNATAADQFQLHVFYGPAGSSSEQLTHYPQFAVIGAVEGVWTGLPTILGIPGTEGGDVISLQMRVCSPFGLYGETPVRQVTLGPASGPGTVVWGTGTTPGGFGPIVPQVGGPENCVPEPSTIALGALAGAFLIFRFRKSNKTN